MSGGRGGGGRFLINDEGYCDFLRLEYKSLLIHAKSSKQLSIAKLKKSQKLCYQKPQLNPCNENLEELEYAYKQNTTSCTTTSQKGYCLLTFNLVLGRWKKKLKKKKEWKQEIFL